MTVGGYLKERASAIWLSVIALTTLSVFLFSVGNTLDTILTIAVTWVITGVAYLTNGYFKRKRFYDELLRTAEKLDKKYLLGEVVDNPPFADAVPYYTLLKMAGKSMLEAINLSKFQQKEYKEYIEQWIHEVKTPIAEIKLIEENNRTHSSRAVLEALDTIDRYVEQALFYARSEETQKDYLIKEISLEEVVHKVLIRNKQMFILNNVGIELSNLDQMVYCDSKWLAFILNQVVVNAVKYRSGAHPVVKIEATEIKNGIQLTIEDNGVGIPEHEIGRVFDKGFTGNTGRQNIRSTGIGLYLCKKLCDKLGLLIAIESIEGKYTKVLISFPKGNFCKEGAI